MLKSLIEEYRVAIEEYSNVVRHAAGSRATSEVVRAMVSSAERRCENVRNALVAAGVFECSEANQ